MSKEFTLAAKAEGVQIASINRPAIKYGISYMISFKNDVYKVKSRELSPWLDARTVYLSLETEIGPIAPKCHLHVKK